MLPVTQFSLPFFDNFEIQGEFEGNKKSGKVIIFSHGFGVKRNSWGMFNEIGDRLKTENLIIRFDYNKIIPYKNATYVFPPSLQSKMLQHVYDYARKNFSPFHISVISHSMGCYITSSTSLPQIDQVILLAPPLTSPYLTLKNYFSKRSGTQFDEKGITVVERSDGSLTYIPPEFWSEVKLANPLKEYQQLTAVSSLYAIRPREDQILTNEPYQKLRKILGHNYFELSGNHDFAPPHRQQLLNLISKLLLH